MAFRNKHDDWEQFVREHAEELLACGVAPDIYRSRQRFFILLDEGWDEGGFLNQECLFTSVTILRANQARSFSEFIHRHFDNEFSWFTGTLDRHASGIECATQINSRTEDGQSKDERTPHPNPLPAKPGRGDKK